MEKKVLQSLSYDLQNNLQTALGLDINSKELDRLREVCELTVSTFSDTASVPETMFARELLEYVLRHEPDLKFGVFSEEDIEEINSDEYDFWEEGHLEMFINPNDLFLNGKIRPDVVFRKGKGNYIVFEVDSFQFHSSQEQLMKDKIRERKIQSLGYPVYRFAAKEILSPAGVYSCMAEAMGALKRHGFIKQKA